MFAQIAACIIAASSLITQSQLDGALRSNHWPTDPAVNLAVCTRTGDDQIEGLCADLKGGAYVLSGSEPQLGHYQQVVQRIRANGVLAWRTNGIPVCRLDVIAVGGQLVPDGSGGAIAVWADQGRGDGALTPVFAQRIDSNGVPRWDRAGVSVDSTVYYYRPFACAPDGRGGVFVVCYDVRDNLPGRGTLYAQWVDNRGRARWGVGGVPLCSAISSKLLAGAIPDGADGFVVLWQDERAQDWQYKLYAQRMDGTGRALWQTDGVLISDLTTEDRPPALITDAVGGAIVTWPATGAGLVAQHVSADGQLAWGAQGVDVTGGVWAVKDPHGVSDGAGGLILCWTDGRSGGWAPYAQALRSDGSIAWGSGGVKLSTSAGGENARLATDGAGGVLVCWYSPDYHVWAQRVANTGEISSGWPSAGVAISIAPGGQLYPTIIAEPSGAILAWSDYRNGLSDIYAQRVGVSGVLGGGAEPAAPVEPLQSVASIGDFSGASALTVRGGSRCEIDYYMPHTARVSLRVFDVSGTLVATLVNGMVESGAHHASWDPQEGPRGRVPSGVYTFVLLGAGETQVVRAVLIGAR